MLNLGIGYVVHNVILYFSVSKIILMQSFLVDLEKKIVKKQSSWQILGIAKTVNLP